ncbi:MAG: transposase [Anaerolineales bacterium]|nr:transposase [Anaerolineales bacterium]
MFVDEAGFYRLPAAVRTDAPRGKTPVLRYRFWDHLSVISAITPAGKLYPLTQAETFRGPRIVRFLKHLLQHIPGKLLVVWDRLPAHRSQVIKEFLCAGGAKRSHLAQLPSYAPDLHPDAGVWNYLKRVELKNVCCHDLLELRSELRKARALAAQNCCDPELHPSSLSRCLCLVIYVWLSRWDF